MGLDYVEQYIRKRIRVFQSKAIVGSRTMEEFYVKNNVSENKCAMAYVVMPVMKTA